MVVRAEAARLPELLQGRLHVAGLVHRAARERGFRPVPVPQVPEPRMTLGEYGLLQLGGRPAPPAIGAHVHARDPTAAAPRYAGDLPPAFLGKGDRVCGEGDDRFRVHDEAEHAGGAVGQRVRVLRRLLASHERPVGDLDPPDPLDVRVSFPTRQQEPSRVALLGTERFAILAVRDQGVVPGLLDGYAPRHHGRVLSLSQEPLGAGLHASLPKQGREGHAGPLARAREAVDELRGEVGPGLPVARGAVSGALDEVQPRDRGKALEGLEVEHHRALDHPVDQEPVTVGVDGRHARVVALEVQVCRSDDPAKILQRRERDALSAPARDTARPLER